MSIVSKALIWAAAILLTALAASYGVIGESAATTMLLALPVLAVTTMAGGRRGKCGIGAGRR